MTEAIKIEGISKSYQAEGGPVRVLESVDLLLKEGEFVALTGESGCGKSTLLLTVGGLMKPDSGSVLIKGTDIYGLGRTARSKFRAKTLGFVFQQFHLIPYLNVMDNVLAPTLALPFDGASAKAEELIGRFKLSDRITHVPSKLSVGEQQRVALARALLHGPAIILADEPTGNIDAENAEIILDTFKDFASNGGTVLMVTHDQRAAEAASKQISLKP